MENKMPQLLQDYQNELHRYLMDAPESHLEEAQELGKRALNLGLDMLDLTRLHQESLIVFICKFSSVGIQNKVIRLAGIFLAEAITPIEENFKAVKKFNSELLTQSLHLQEELRTLSRGLLVVQEEERRRISRELHDIVTQSLTGINLRLAALTLQTDVNTEDIHEKIAETQKLVEQSVDVVDRFARDLRPTVLDDLGLIPALKSYLQDFKERSGIRASLSTFAGVEKLNSTVRTVLYRVAQEALINVANHSEATNAKVSIKKIKDVVRLEIHDDGKGFEVDSSVRLLSCHRLGLLGMKERAKMIGGQLLVTSELGKGTTIRVDAPLPSDCSSSPSENKPSPLLK